ncbi:hypothetical protein AYI70_g10503, partial [Smittium culicis]
MWIGCLSTHDLKVSLINEEGLELVLMEATDMATSQPAV